MKTPEPFFLHRWVEQDLLRSRRFNNGVYLTIAAGFILISARFLASFETTGTAIFDTPVILLFFTLLAFSNMATVSAAYPDPANRSFYAQTQWKRLAATLYPWACWLALASTAVMLLGTLWLVAADELRTQQDAALVWAAGLTLSSPALLYRTLFSRPIG